MSVVLANRPVAAGWSNHRRKWSTCDRCPLGLTCDQHVLGRGKLPCEVLFFGEAPGPAENALGTPFVGRSGKVLDSLLNDVRRLWRPFSWFISNALGCYPRQDEESGNPDGFRQPSPAELDACFPRVEEVVQLAHPRAIVYLGKHAEGLQKRLSKSKAFSDLYLPDHHLAVWHPSYILRNGGVGSLQYKQTVHKVFNFLKGVTCVEA